MTADCKRAKVKESRCPVVTSCILNDSSCILTVAVVPAVTLPGRVDIMYLAGAAWNSGHVIVE